MTTEKTLFVSWLKQFEYEETPLGDFARAVGHDRKGQCLTAVGYDAVTQHMIEHHGYTETDISVAQVWVTYASDKENPDEEPFTRWVRRHSARMDVKGRCAQYIRRSANLGSLRAKTPLGVVRFVMRQNNATVLGRPYTDQARVHIKTALEQLVNEYSLYRIYGNPAEVLPEPDSDEDDEMRE